MPLVCKKYKFYLLIISFFLISGCKSENPNPELKDPIYLDLKTVLGEHQSALDAEKKVLASAEKTLANTSISVVDRTIERRSAKKSRQKIPKMAQQVRYYEIRLERRRVEARKAYKLAFKRGEKWPNPKEHEYYLTNKKLSKIDLNWNKRVPKLFSGNPNYTPPQMDESTSSTTAE